MKFELIISRMTAKVLAISDFTKWQSGVVRRHKSFSGSTRDWIAEAAPRAVWPSLHTRAGYLLETNEEDTMKTRTVIAAACIGASALAAGLAHAENNVTLSGSLAGGGVSKDTALAKNEKQKAGSGTTTFGQPVTFTASQASPKPPIGKQRKSGATSKIGENESPRPSDR